jgi:hypothetical protein
MGYICDRKEQIWATCPHPPTAGGRGDQRKCGTPKPRSAPNCAAREPGAPAVKLPHSSQLRAPASIHFGMSHLEYTEEGGKSYIVKADGISQRGRLAHFGMVGFSKGTVGRQDVHQSRWETRRSGRGAPPTPTSAKRGQIWGAFEAAQTIWQIRAGHRQFANQIHRFFARRLAQNDSSKSLMGYGANSMTRY